METDSREGATKLFCFVYFRLVGWFLFLFFVFVKCDLQICRATSLS